MKYRIVEVKHNGYTHYIVQRRILFIWFTYQERGIRFSWDKEFDTYDEALNYLESKVESNKPAIKKIIYETN